MKRVWHRWQHVPAEIHVRDGLGSPWKTIEHNGGLVFTDGMHVVQPRDIEYPVEEQ